MKEIYRAWKTVAQKIGDFQASIIFSLLYFLLFTPMGLIASRFRASLKIKQNASWEKVELKLNTIKELESL